MESGYEFISKSDRIIAHVTESIRNGVYKAGHPIPSINSASERFGVARKTVIRAYEKLKNLGYIESRPQKGYFVVNNRPNSKLRVLLIFQSFNGHWEILYNEFREQVEQFCDVEIFFHHYNIKILELLINRDTSNYDLYIISSFDHPRIKNVIGRIPAHKVLVLSRNDFLGNKYNSIIQDFDEGTYKSLVSADKKISGYKELVLSFSKKSVHPETLRLGFERYCKEFSRSFRVVNSLKNIEVKKGQIFLVIDDGDLIKLLNICKVRNWELGKDVGVISYNETPLKGVIRDGITVISCNFSLMASEMVLFIKKPKSVNKVVPINYIDRNSL